MSQIMEKSPVYQILVVDDDPLIRQSVREAVAALPCALLDASNAAEMKQIIDSSAIDLVLLDIQLPDDDGFSICHRLRSSSDVSIIMLTGAGSVTQRVVGLELGADDYIVKPFAGEELAARVMAVLRRTHAKETHKNDATECFAFDGFHLYVAKRELTGREGESIPLSDTELALLLVFLRNPGVVYERDKLTELALGQSFLAFDRRIDTHMCRLRRKIEIDPNDPKIIKTVRAKGYVLVPAVTKTFDRNHSGPPL